jgi:predicted nuclease with TOPRIM domain
MAVAVAGQKSARLGQSSLDIFHRLETSQEELRAQVNEIKTNQVVVNTELQQLSAQIRHLVQRAEDASKTEWPKYAVIMGLITLIVGPAGFFLTLYINGSVVPVKSDIAQSVAEINAIKTAIHDLTSQYTTRERDITNLIQSTTANNSRLQEIATAQQRIGEMALSSQAADVNSRTDRDQLNNRVKTLETDLAHEVTTRNAEQAANRVNHGEVETQFHAVSNIENLRWAYQNRLNTVLFNRTHPGENWPAENFFPPTIFQSVPSGGGTPDVDRRG